MKLFGPGDTIVVTEDPYGGTCRLLDKVYHPLGIDVVYVDTSQLVEVEKVFERNVKAVLIESPTNPLQRIADIPAICRIAREKGALTIVDNTFLTPYFQRPIPWERMWWYTAPRNTSQVTMMFLRAFL